MASLVRYRHSIKTRITLATLAIFLTSLWALSFYAARMLQEDMERISGEQQFSTATYAAAEVEGKFEDRIKALEMIARAIDSSLIANPAALQEFLDQRFVLHGQFNDGVMAYGTDGTAIAVSPRAPERIGVNDLDRDYLVGALKDGKSTIGRPVLGRTQKSPGFLMAVPIRDQQGKVIGALSGVTNLGKPNFLDRVTANRYGKTGGFVLLIPQYRQIVTATDKSRIMEILPAAGIIPTLDRFLDGFEGSAVYTTPLKVEVLGSAKKISISDWLMGVTLPTAEAFAPILRMHQRMALATLLLTLLAGGLTWWLLKRQLSPLTDTAHALAGLSDRGDYPKLLPVDRPDEIGQLIGSFNHLLGLLASREAALRQSESQYKSLFNEIPVGYHEYDTEGRIVRVNATELAMLGYSADEMLGHQVWEFIDNSERSKAGALSKLAGITPPGNNFERDYLKKDGTRIPTLIKDNIRCDSDGRITGICCIVMYIAELKQAEEALQKSEIKYRLLAENAADWIFWIDVNANVRYASPACANISGYSAEEFVADADLMARIIHPDDRARYLAHMASAVAPDNLDLELRIVRADGELRWISHQCVPIHDAAGTLVGRQGTNHDITDRKQSEDALRESEQRFRSLMENIPNVAVQGYLLDGTVTFWNGASENLYGYSAKEAIGGNLLNLIIPSEMTQGVAAAMRQMAATGIPIPAGELLLKKKDGSRVPIYSSHALISPVGRQPELFCLDHDLTASKKSAAELEQYRSHLEELVAARTAELDHARKVAEAANLAKSAFLANMSHEIRTPMNAVLGMSHLLRCSDLDATQIDRLDKIETASDHLLKVIDDILDLSKIEAGKFALEDAPVSVSSLLADISSIMGARAQAKGLILQVDSDTFPPNLQGDQTRLQQAVLNYVSNAIKFTQAGVITLRAIKQKETEAEVSVCFEVEDSGIGIPPETLPRLFSPFEQADNSSTRKYGGTGLGLVITRRLAELMGGEAGVESTDGVGSTFWFTVILQRKERRNELAPEPGIDAEALLRQRYRGARVLLVDDEPINLEVAQYLLELSGLVVDTAEDGSEAVDRAREVSYAIILMDVQMPKLDGLAATRQIRALHGHSETPILAMTANAFVEDKALFLEAGMNDCLIKPFNPDMLFTILIKHLDQRSRS